MRQLLASFLLYASWEIHRPGFHRWELARRDLLRCMRADARPNYMRPNAGI